ncbi:hypothetical protein GCM10023333_14120 [Ferrimonas pelagia]|uniref:HTH tetR-type domain-containing protein n=1 Tax=Ferrimonas pelagia TaxID=1177826 RepID=A0ABP9EJW3_9GAMM
MWKDSEQISERILNAAEVLIQKQGALTFNFTDLCKPAKTSMRNVYRMFPDRQSLFVALATRRLRNLNRCLLSLNQAIESPQEQVLSHGLLSGRPHECVLIRH